MLHRFPTPLHYSSFVRLLYHCTFHLYSTIYRNDTSRQEKEWKGYLSGIYLNRLQNGKLPYSESSLQLMGPWKFKFSGMWHWVTWWVVPNISQNHTAFIFRFKQSKEMILGSTCLMTRCHIPGNFKLWADQQNCDHFSTVKAQHLWHFNNRKHSTAMKVY